MPEKEAAQGTGHSNKKIGWGMKKNKGAPPDIPQEVISLLRRYDGYYLGKSEEKFLYLTFDEGYENGYTASILDTLKERQVPAAFFVTGPYIKKEPDLVLRMVNEGHIVGNHTVRHPSMPDVTDDEKLVAELTELDEMFHGLTGQRMKYLRPPRGEFSERTLFLSQKAGYKTIFWSSAYRDWVLGNNSRENAFRQVTQYFHNGSIILLHAVSPENAAALPDIIKAAREQGYTFASLDDL